MHIGVNKVYSLICVIEKKAFITSENNVRYVTSSEETRKYSAARLYVGDNSA